MRCNQCKGQVKFDPHSQSLKCSFCSYENPLINDHLIINTPYEKTKEVLSTATYNLKCSECNAVKVINSDIASDVCPFCNTTIIAEGGSTRIIKPGYVLPFKINNEEAQAIVKRCISKLWFAPNAFKALTKANMEGLYVPYWAFNGETVTDYKGERGENYLDTEFYTTIEDGKPVTKTRLVTKTRWYSCSGTVDNSHKDVLIKANSSLPASYNWDTDNLVSYNDGYLAGFKTYSYNLNVDEGLVKAKKDMQSTINNTIYNDIGGDNQRISSKSTTYNDLAFKLLLLPLWLSSYNYKNKDYTFTVNGRTGYLEGDRPLSWVKITLFILAILAIVAMIVLGVIKWGYLLT